jgi:diadenosine tetraphosphatase ApaH/serine/threonine PP2A family protein phosphatase
VRYAILSDIHSNLEALNAVLRHIRRYNSVDELWCLGDIVGYGPDPKSCIALINEYSNSTVCGNHDLGAADQVNPKFFNPDAAIAIQWTKEQLKIEKEYLAKLPVVLTRNQFTLVHGSPRDPVWGYMFSLPVAQENFNYFETKYCLVGHTHQPAIFKQEEPGREPIYIPFQPNIGQVLGKGRYIINPGSVGQPRDGDARASYAIYDDSARIIRLYRVEYDIEATQHLMLRYNLPLKLGLRLSEGI